MMRLPIRILSDLHLGHRASRITDAESLRPLFKGIDTVIFNGDTWESLAEPWRETSAALLGEMKRILNEEGCDAVFLRGNHDPDWPGKASISLAGGRVVVMHGDALLRHSSPWKHEILDGAAAVEAIWFAHPLADSDLDQRLEVAHKIAVDLPSRKYPTKRGLVSRVLDAAFPPKRAFSMLMAWIFQGSLGARFCESYLPDAEFLIIGHFHFAACISTNNKIIINTGSFVIPGPAAYVDWDGSCLSTGMVLRKNHAFHPGAPKHRWHLP